jgi:hypothetical protein
LEYNTRRPIPKKEILVSIQNEKKKEERRKKKEERMIRVGRCKDQSLKGITPCYEGFKNVIVMTKSSKYGELGPYLLRDDEGHIMENIWQFSKVYPHVPKSTQYYSQWDRTVIWDHPEERHIDPEGRLTTEYLVWRSKGFSNEYAVRYPVGMKYHHTCVGSFIMGETVMYGYIAARKKIYLPVYCELVRKQPLFDKLKQDLDSGINLLIIEVDGPHQESLGYYRETYKVSDDFIVNHTMLATEHNLKIMVNDTKHAFGHGYCLASALLDLTNVLIS